MSRMSRRIADQAIAAARAQIEADVRNPRLRSFARCEGSAVGIYGHCILCEADQGEESPFCVKNLK